MKHALVISILLIILLIGNRNINAQSTTSNITSKKFYFVAGIGIGGFYPQDINDYISSRYSGSYAEIGSTDLFMYFAINASGSFFFSKYTELQLETEFAFATKFVINGDETDTYFFRRITPAVKFNFHIPIGKRASYFIGPAVSYSLLSFSASDEDKLKGYTPGVGGQTGVMLRFRKFAIEPFISFNYIKAKVKDAPETTFPDYLGFDNYNYIKDLSFVDGSIGCKFFF